MVPFSPDRDSLAENTSKSSPGISSSPSKIFGGDSQETPPDDTPGIVASSEEANTVADGEIDAATETTPSPTVAAVSSAPEPTDIVGGGALNTVQSFCFSDEDDDDNDFMTGKAAAESERLSTPFTASTAKGDGLEGSNAESVGDGGSDRGGGSDSSRSGGTDGVRSGGRGGESLRADGSSDGPIQTGSGDSGEKSTERQSTERRSSSRIIPNPVGFDSEKSSEADRSSPVEGEGLALARSTPATAGTWAHPDFGFSSDDELNIDLSSSGVSSSRQAEGKGEGELTPPPSSSPIQGSYDGFDSSSVAS